MKAYFGVLDFHLKMLGGFDENTMYHTSSIYCFRGVSFLRPELSNIQFYNLTLIATALVLGTKFSLSQINRAWLEEKCVSTLSHFMSHAKFSTAEMQHLYALQVMHLYKIKMSIALTHHLFFSTLKRPRNKGLHNAQKTANSIFCNGTGLPAILCRYSTYSL